MKLETLALPEQNKVMQSYNNDKDFLHTYFDYNNDNRSFQSRLNELADRKFERKNLAEVIRSFMEPFGVSHAAENHIKELADNGVVIVGGQQAGILTGPMYSVHKAISVILLAEKQRKALGIPVIPVFWVAGEDHDLNEINHVYTESGSNHRLSKNQFQQSFVLKLMASDATYDEDKMTLFVKEIFSTFGETAYTNVLLSEVLDAVKTENTFTGFFVRLMNGLFQEEGLLFIDSAYKPLRVLESSYFTQLIKESDKIAQVILKKEEQFSSAGYGNPIGAQADGAHLFYVHETGRVLLARKDGLFVNESVGINFTEAEMLRIAKNEPWLLSNNVATRPLMQDFVFPVLAFVGGAGEIAYWALLKEAFHHLHMKMPIIIQRMSLTLVTPRTKLALETKSLSVMDVLAGKVPPARERLIDELRDDEFNSVVEETERLLYTQYEKMGHQVEERSPVLGELLQKNLEFHKRQFSYLRDKAEEELLIKHDVLLRAFSEMESEIFPSSTLQERIVTPYPYLNIHGPTLIKDLLRLPYEMNGTHNVVYL